MVFVFGQVYSGRFRPLARRLRHWHVHNRSLRTLAWHCLAQNVQLELLGPRLSVSTPSLARVSSSLIFAQSPAQSIPIAPWCPDWSKVPASCRPTESEAPLRELMLVNWLRGSNFAVLSPSIREPCILRQRGCKIISSLCSWPSVCHRPLPRRLSGNVQCPTCSCSRLVQISILVYLGHLWPWFFDG